MSKRVREEKEEEEQSTSSKITSDQSIFCNYHPCFNHEHTCESCLKVFPDKKFLSLHIDENHNPILQIKQERGDKIFKCYTESCKAVFSNPKERKHHLIEIHNYPTDYPFNIVNDGI